MAILIQMTIIGSFLLLQVEFIRSQNFILVNSGEIVNDNKDSFGHAWADYDADGDLDLFVANIDGINNILFRNNGQPDYDFSSLGATPLVMDGMSSISATWGDYDNDGFLDLFVAHDNDSSNCLYRGAPLGSFIAIQAGKIVEDRGKSRGCSWVDYDNDGLLDLFVVNGFFNGESRNFLYRNVGNGNFVKIETGIVVTEQGSSRAGIWGDYNDDGFADLYVVNDRDSSSSADHENFLYKNNGDGTFEKITSGAIVTDKQRSFGANWVDYDDDGDLDLYVVNSNDQDNALYQNEGAGDFIKITNLNIANQDGRSFASAWGDYDNDGDSDLFVANFRSNFLYQNNGDRTFSRIEGISLTDTSTASRGSSWIDYNNDGSLDLYVSNNGLNNFLFRNDASVNNWISISLEGQESNRSAIGAKVKVKARIFGASKWQMRYITGQHGTQSQMGLRAHFGLGDATTIDSIVVEWPNGRKSNSANVNINQFLNIVEPTQSKSRRIEWNNPSGGRWNESDNWSIGQVPGPDDDVSIILPSNYVVTVDTNSFASNLRVGGGDGLQILYVIDTLEVSNITTIEPGGRLKLENGVIREFGSLFNFGHVIFKSGLGRVNFTNSGLFEVFRGANFIQAVRDSFKNKPSGMIKIMSSDSLRIGSLALNGFVNEGTIQIKGTDQFGATLFVEDGTLRNKGVIESNDTLNVSHARASFINEGILRPGNSPGRFDFLGNYMDHPSAEIQIEIDGPLPAMDYDQLFISGNAGFSGTLDIEFGDGFTPSLGDTFCVIYFDTLTEAFPFQNIKNHRLSERLLLDPVYTEKRLCMAVIDSLEDIEAPLITHTPPATIVAGSEAIISTNLEDNIGIQSAMLFHRIGGMTRYTSVDMHNTNADTYQAQIPASAVTIRGVEYYIQAQDSSGNITTEPDENPVDKPHVVQVENNMLAFDFVHTADSAYRMISVPFDLDNKSAAGVIAANFGSAGYDSIRWRLQRYIDGGYVEYPDFGIGSDFWFEPGNAFWLITREEERLAPVAGKSVATADSFVITLQPGWNQIGNPFAFVVEWQDVRRGDVEDQLWDYAGSVNEQQGYFQSAELEPWKGYFVRNRSSTITTIAIPPNEPSERPYNKTQAAFKDGEWSLRLVAENEIAVDRENYVGALQNAANQWDVHDFSEPPVVSNYVSLYFPNSHWERYPGNYSGDFRSPDPAGHYWDFEVETNVSLSKIRLVTDDLQNLPAGWELLLLDKSGSFSTDFDEGKTYAYLSGEDRSARMFRLVAGPPDFIEENDLDFKAVPESFSLSQNYPNPFNPETRLNYELPAATHVKLVVYNLLGQKIRTLFDAKQNPGRYSELWDGRSDSGLAVSSGVYIIRLRAASYIASRKAVLIR